MDQAFKLKIQYQKNELFYTINTIKYQQNQMFKPSDKENYNYLDHLVSNCQQSCIFSTVIIEPKAKTLGDKGHQTVTQNFISQGKIAQKCSKHTQRRGEYFQSQSPWIRYCQTCALNLALCGKRIQKSLTSEQMLTKITLIDTLQSLSQTIKQSQTQQQQYSFLSSQLQTSRQHFITIIKQIDSFIKQLCQVKSYLQQQVQDTISSKIKEMFQRQALVVSKKVELINEKNKIECQFADMISKQSQEMAKNEIQMSKKLVKETEDLFVCQGYRVDLAQMIRNVEAIFNSKTSQINAIQIRFSKESVRLNTQCEELRMSTMFTRKVMSKLSCKTEPAHQYDLQGQGKRMLTTCDTTQQHSGLISPAQLLTSPLGEINQNRRSSRTALQLKQRCRSKSGQRKIEVNVRGDVETALKKKLG